MGQKQLKTDLRYQRYKHKTISRLDKTHIDTKAIIAKDELQVIAFEQDL